MYNLNIRINLYFDLKQHQIKNENINLFEDLNYEFDKIYIILKIKIKD